MLRRTLAYLYDDFCLLLPRIAHKVDPLANELRELAAGIEEIIDEQEYTIARERTHRNSKSHPLL